MKALGVTTKERHPALPDLPTLVEFGFPDLVVSSWQGIFVPAATPKPVVDKLHGVMSRGDGRRRRQAPYRRRRLDCDRPARSPEDAKTFVLSEASALVVPSPRRSAPRLTESLRPAERHGQMRARGP